MHSFDPILPLGITHLVCDVYGGMRRGEASRARGLPLLSPYHAPDTTLEQFPRFVEGLNLANQALSIGALLYLP